MSAGDDGFQLLTFTEYRELSAAERDAFWRAFFGEYDNQALWSEYGMPDDELLPTFFDFNTGIALKIILPGTVAMGMSAAEWSVACELNPRGWSEEPVAAQPVKHVDVGALLVSVTPLLIGEYQFLMEKQNELVAGPPVWPCHTADLTRSDAEAFCEKWPTEAEWEYCCRGGTTSLFPWGDHLPPDGEMGPWLDLNFSGNRPKAANGFGLKALFSGEWCADPYRTSHAPDAPTLPGEYVIKGGAAQYWPWRDNNEWLWCASGMRGGSAEFSGDAPDPYAAVRLIRDLTPAWTLRREQQYWIDKLEALEDVQTQQARRDPWRHNDAIASLLVPGRWMLRSSEGSNRYLLTTGQKSYIHVTVNVADEPLDFDRVRARFPFRVDDYPFLCDLIEEGPLDVAGEDHVAFARLVRRKSMKNWDETSFEWMVLLHTGGLAFTLRFALASKFDSARWLPFLSNIRANKR